jgi:ketosteroid isomerase-like protein
LHKYEALIRRYFDACNAGDHAALMSCFTSDAEHYFPPGLPEIPWRGAQTIAAKWVWCVENLGSQWTIERVLVAPESHEAVIEWTHWKRKSGTAQRGDEWYVFDPDGANGQGLIREIRAYYAAPAVKDLQDLPRSASGVAMGELVNFDYRGRGYHLRWDDRPEAAK